MSEPPRRPILKLKFAPAPRPASLPETGVFIPPPKPPRPARAARPAKPAPEAAPKVVHPWKCRPCGTGLSVPETLADEDYVRCPGCNARLGRAGDFRAEPPLVEKLRARPGKGG